LSGGSDFVRVSDTGPTKLLNDNGHSSSP